MLAVLLDYIKSLVCQLEQFMEIRSVGRRLHRTDRRADRDIHILAHKFFCGSDQFAVQVTGDLFDFITSSYDLDEAIIKGSGRNYGLSLMLHKQAGSLTGWIAYNLGRSLRSFDVPGYSGEYPSNHERLHEFNMVATWNGRKWSAGASMVAATGTPFTAPDSFYLMGNRIISHYGAHNSNRLAPYFRTDLSFNWYFIKSPEKTFGANFSVYNATMRQNQLFCKLKIEDGKVFAYRPVHIGFTILPSISIFYRI